MPSPESFVTRYDVARYFALADDGLLPEGERTELLDGLIVAMAPQSPVHAAAVYRVEQALRSVLPEATVIRVQMPLVAGPTSVPEPDIAVLGGREQDYVARHPGTARLVVEIAIATVSQDRLTKTAIYAAAGVEAYWIVQPVEEWVEVHRRPNPQRRAYSLVSRHRVESRLEVPGFDDVLVDVATLFPPRPR